MHDCALDSSTRINVAMTVSRPISFRRKNFVIVDLNNYKRRREIQETKQDSVNAQDMLGSFHRRCTEDIPDNLEEHVV